MNIEFKNVSKKIKKQSIFTDVNVELKSGLIHGIVGPQGSGKTTFLKLISRKAVLHNGEILYNNKNMKNKDLSLIHISSQIIALSSFRKTLKSYKNKFPNFDLEYAIELAEKFKIIDSAITATHASSGMISAANIVVSLASNEELVILDEVIVGLDIFNRKIFYEELIKKYNKDKQTFIIASSLLDELTPLLNNFVLLANGSVVHSGSLDILDNAFVLSGNKEKLEKYETNSSLVKKEVGNFKEIIVFDKGEFDVESRNATLLDMVESYGKKNEIN